MSFVVDASAALSWLLPRLDPAEQSLSSHWLDLVPRERVLAPAIFTLEVVNSLLVAERGALSSGEAEGFLRRLSAMNIELQPAPDLDAAPSLRIFARATGLTAYDATYLDLALRTGSSLATFDRRLAIARDREGIGAP